MASTQNSQDLKNKDGPEVMHNWAETAVSNFQNLVGCLTWKGKDKDQSQFLSVFVGDLLQGFVDLRTQKPPFSFESFSHAIDVPVVVFEYDEHPASYHAVVADLVNSWVIAMFPEKVPSEISRQDAETINAADIKRITKALSDVTGHDGLKDIKRRLRRLASGIEKEHERLKTCHPSRQRADSKTDKGRKNLPESVDVLDLCRNLQKELPRLKSQGKIAREFTNGDVTKAENLLRQARRYRHLWEKSN